MGCCSLISRSMRRRQPMKGNLLDKLNGVASGLAGGASPKSPDEQKKGGKPAKQPVYSSDDGGAFSDDSDTEEFLKAHRMKQLQKKGAQTKRSGGPAHPQKAPVIKVPFAESSEALPSASNTEKESTQLIAGSKPAEVEHNLSNLPSSSSQRFSSTKKPSNELNDADFETSGEDIEDYGPEGYHPVYLGEKFKAGRYTVLQKLGWGHFSTVWLSEDNLFPRKDVNPPAIHQYVALKIQRSKANHSEAALDEIKLLKSLKESRKRPSWHNDKEFLKQKGMNIADDETFCVEVLDHFPHYGPHGKHYCATFELLGPSLLELMKFFQSKFDQGLPIWITKKIAQQVLVGLHFAHVHGQIIHTDLKPENVMIQIPSGLIKTAVELLRKRAKRPTSEKYLIKKNMLHLPRKEIFSQGCGNASLNVSGFSQDTLTESDLQLHMLGKRIPASVLESNLEGSSDGAHLVNQQADTTTENTNTIMSFPDSQNQPFTSEQAMLEYRTSRYFEFMWKDQVALPIDEHIKIKIVDFGNGCWVHKHFTPNIQTREYRSPEAIIGHEYYANTDMWSAACMFFELLTTHYLFRPDTPETSPEKAVGGEGEPLTAEKVMALLNSSNCVTAPKRPKIKYPRDEIHLSLFMSTLGPLPDRLWRGGSHSGELFSSKGKLKHQPPFQAGYNIAKQLTVEYEMEQHVADSIESALRPMLAYLPRDRADGWMALQHPWWWSSEDGCKREELPGGLLSTAVDESNPPQTQATLTTQLGVKPSKKDNISENQDGNSTGGYASSSSRKKKNNLKVVESSESEEDDIVLPEHYR